MVAGVQLLVATVVIAWMSELLVGAVEEASHAFGLTEVFVGVIVVAIVGNAAEHSTAVLVARKNHMDLALNIAVGRASRSRCSWRRSSSSRPTSSAPRRSTSASPASKCWPSESPSSSRTPSHRTASRTGSRARCCSPST
jgi:hypothetical protein